MFRFIWMICNLIQKCHEGTMPSIQIIGSFTSQFFKDFCHFVREHSSGTILSSIHQKQAIMSWLTNKSFHNLIREDERQQIEASIWEQIDSGNENDYIHFHLRKADGSYLSVLDHGRIVESPQYGKVFYVLFMDWEDMHIHYSDKFSG